MTDSDPMQAVRLALRALADGDAVVSASWRDIAGFSGLREAFVEAFVLRLAEAGELQVFAVTPEGCSYVSPLGPVA